MVDNSHRCEGSGSRGGSWSGGDTGEEEGLSRTESYPYLFDMSFFHCTKSKIGILSSVLRLRKRSRTFLSRGQTLIRRVLGVSTPVLTRDQSACLERLGTRPGQVSCRHGRVWGADLDPSASDQSDPGIPRFNQCESKNHCFTIRTLGQANEAKSFF